MLNPIRKTTLANTAENPYNISGAATEECNNEIKNYTIFYSLDYEFRKKIIKESNVETSLDIIKKTIKSYILHDLNGRETYQTEEEKRKHLFLLEKYVTFANKMADSFGLLVYEAILKRKKKEDRYWDIAFNIPEDIVKIIQPEYNITKLELSMNKSPIFIKMQ